MFRTSKRSFAKAQQKPKPAKTTDKDKAKVKKKPDKDQVEAAKKRQAAKESAPKKMSEKAKELVINAFKRLEVPPLNLTPEELARDTEIAKR